MKIRRFFTTKLSEAAPSCTTNTKSNVLDFITPQSVPIYEEAMYKYDLAKKYLEAGNHTKAFVHIEAAIKASLKLRGQTPVIASIRTELFELEDNIESIRKSSKKQ